MSGNAIVIEGPQAIAMYRLAVLKARLSMEVAGMKGRGPSTYSVVKREFGLTGSKQKVYEDFCRLLEELKRGQA